MARREIRLRKRIRSPGSRPAVGSSSTSSLGRSEWPGRSPAAAASPPDSAPIRLLRFSSRLTKTSAASMLSFAFATPFYLAHIVQKFLYGKICIELRVLGHIANLVEVAPAHLDGVFTVQMDHAAAGRQYSNQNIDQCRLASSIWPQQAVDAFCQNCGNILERGIFSIKFCDAFKFQFHHVFLTEGQPPVRGHSRHPYPGLHRRNDR